MGSLRYDVAFAVALRRAGILKWLIIVCWFLVPVLGQTIMHPTDAAGFWYWLNSQHPPRFYSSQEVVRGEFTAVLALGAVIFVYLVAITLFYRRAQYFLALWPIAALLVGVIGNAGWWFDTSDIGPEETAERLVAEVESRTEPLEPGWQTWLRRVHNP